MGNSSQVESQETTVWKSIIVFCDPRAKEFILGITEETKAADVLEIIQQQCQSEGVDLKKWREKLTGSADTPLILMRKKTGNTQLPPDVVLSSLNDLDDKEIFKLGTAAVVG